MAAVRRAGCNPPNVAWAFEVCPMAHGFQSMPSFFRR